MASVRSAPATRSTTVATPPDSAKRCAAGPKVPSSAAACTFKCVSGSRTSRKISACGFVEPRAVATACTTSHNRSFWSACPTRSQKRSKWPLSLYFWPLTPKRPSRASALRTTARSPDPNRSAIISRGGSLAAVRSATLLRIAVTSGPPSAWSTVLAISDVAMRCRIMRTFSSRPAADRSRKSIPFLSATSLMYPMTSTIERAS
mmetsp:Transcript_16763/g.43519  ORF Transcript_16763/g.43519 Transcript_16763/m.43519 type:complete len:204 (+) Transcript_16763:788-1399(+)